MSIPLEDAYGKTYLITGGAGSLGRRIAQYLLERIQPKAVRLFDNHENGLARIRHLHPDVRLRYLVGDIRDRTRVLRAMENVDICIHAAALKHVDLCECNPFESVNTNVLGTQNCIEAALECEIEKFLFLSSDKAVQAISTYGRCKALSESLTLDAENYKGDRRTAFAIARPPNYIDSDGSIFDLWKYQKEHNLPITVTDEGMVRYFMKFDGILKFVVQCVNKMKGGEIFVPIGAEKHRILDLARSVSSNIEIIGKRPGEKLLELLIDPEEMLRAEQQDGMWVIHSKVEKHG